MKSAFLVLATLCFSASVSSHPQEAFKHIAKRDSLEGRTATFNAKDQRVSTTGTHAWKAPDSEAGDVRGPCPG